MNTPVLPVLPVPVYNPTREMAGTVWGGSWQVHRKHRKHRGLIPVLCRSEGSSRPPARRLQPLIRTLQGQLGRFVRLVYERRLTPSSMNSSPENNDFQNDPESSRKEGGEKVLSGEVITRDQYEQRRRRRRLDLRTPFGIERESARIYRELAEGRVGAQTADVRSRVLSRHSMIAAARREQQPDPPPEVEMDVSALSVEELKLLRQLVAKCKGDEVAAPMLALPNAEARETDGQEPVL